MLGIRHWRGIAIDLWQGEARDFVCDSLLCLLLDEHAPNDFQLTAHSSVGNLQLQLQLQAPRQGWTQAAATAAYSQIFAASKGRHLALPLLPLQPPSQAADIALASLKSAIAAGRLAGDCRCITFLAADGDTYNYLQTSLFACFPEGDT